VSRVHRCSVLAKDSLHYSLTYSLPLAFAPLPLPQLHLTAIGLVAMRDPFPFPPFLQQAVEPFSAFSGLQTLPLHAHEILLASLFYHCVFAYIAPALSAKLVAGRYQILSTDGKLRWNMKCVSFVQSFFISALALWVMVVDKDRAAMSLEERIWGYTGAAGMVQAFAIGYFVWDTYIMARYTKVFGPAMLAHGLACTIVFSLGFVSPA
jgi:hypothetical protein